MTNMEIFFEQEPPPWLADLARQEKWLVLSKPGSSGLWLHFGEDGLSLVSGQQRMRPLRIDFADYWRRPPGKQDVFSKAIGVRHGLRQVWDLTAGLGKESAFLLALGCEVVAVEQSPVVYALLRDAVDRAARLPGAGERLARLHLVRSTAEEWMASPAMPAPEVIYLDPMFPDLGKTALAGREMQMLQALLPEPEPEALENLLSRARELALRRVVLKRPRLAPELKPKPDLQMSGRAVRFDVWLKAT